MKKRRADSDEIDKIDNIEDLVILLERYHDVLVDYENLGLPIEDGDHRIEEIIIFHIEKTFSIKVQRTRPSLGRLEKK